MKAVEAINSRARAAEPGGVSTIFAGIGSTTMVSWSAGLEAHPGWMEGGGRSCMVECGNRAAQATEAHPKWVGGGSRPWVWLAIIG
jgi:hypothetical protein